MDGQLEADRMASEAPPVQIETETGIDTVPGQTIPSVVSEKFISVDRGVVIARALDKLFDTGQRVLAGDVFQYICALRQVESARWLDSLVELYDPFNPDDETVNVVKLGPDRRTELLPKLRKSIIETATAANYIQIGQDELEKILGAEYHQGFAAEVDLKEFDFHLLFYRGDVKIPVNTTSWKTAWLIERPVEVDAYRRLFIGLKLKPVETRVAEIMRIEKISREKAEKRVKKIRNQKMLEGVSEETLHLKIFRRIPKSDIEILFPNAKIKFNLFDKLWLWIGSGGSTIFAIVMAALKFVAAVALSLFFVIFTIAGAVGAIIRSFTSFLNTRTRYMAKLAQSLYFHNIASNQSVLAALNDDAEEEDIKEAVLTYALLLRYGHLGLEATKIEADRFLKTEFSIDCDFEIEDGCRHLRKLGLLVADDAGAPRIRDLEDARGHLEGLWRAVPTAA
ncbi:hypothetical protein Rvan_2185 [Rhodomicrobium vannielii ATCC 17100]|uniref:DUF3754 domain-containing protein n=1 Tax=Rhodomicrobium vannielii (strain ATCC 17100 / DSM 162 / LMG 4299 / NCIMB 10020 / ATH 3.1.1) TaxID=648757 RepID=E3I2Q1_RHOVT|nr:TMEM143 family protein [Rhodomicrobium vannielii]ADP71410.1 hypothetical protein Rvan_2185 [Rhodomicrobium vannielii ATCC 17100]